MMHDNEWINIHSKLPEANLSLVYCAGWGICLGSYHQSECLWYVQPYRGKWFYTGDAVTHWQPLPDKPSFEANHDGQD
jgi:hypothetical protein